MKRSIHLEVFYDAPIDTVWDALTDPEALADWLMDNDFEPRPGHRFQFRTKPTPGWDGTVDCEVLEVEPPTASSDGRLSYTWCNARNGVDTVVTWTLRRHGSGSGASGAPGTMVTLDHTGFQGVRAIMVSELLRRGWKSNLLDKQLPRLLRKWAAERSRGAS